MGWRGSEGGEMGGGYRLRRGRGIIGERAVGVFEVRGDGWRVSGYNGGMVCILGLR